MVIINIKTKIIRNIVITCIEHYTLHPIPVMINIYIIFNFNIYYNITNTLINKNNILNIPVTIDMHNTPLIYEY